MVAQHRGVRLGITTKGALILRDLELLQRIHERSRALASTSRSSPRTPSCCGELEPWAPPPDVRLEVMRRLVEAGHRDLRSAWRPSCPASPTTRPTSTGCSARVAAAGRAAHVHERAVPALADASEKYLRWLAAEFPRHLEAYRKAYASACTCGAATGSGSSRPLRGSRRSTASATATPPAGALPRASSGSGRARTRAEVDEAAALAAHHVGARAVLERPAEAGRVRDQRLAAAIDQVVDPRLDLRPHAAPRELAGAVVVDGARSGRSATACARAACRSRGTRDRPRSGSRTVARPPRGRSGGHVVLVHTASTPCSRPGRRRDRDPPPPPAITTWPFAASCRITSISTTCCGFGDETTRRQPRPASSIIRLLAHQAAGASRGEERADRLDGSLKAGSPGPPPPGSTPHDGLVDALPSQPVDERGLSRKPMLPCVSDTHT